MAQIALFLLQTCSLYPPRAGFPVVNRLCLMPIFDNIQSVVVGILTLGKGCFVLCSVYEMQEWELFSTMEQTI